VNYAEAVRRIMKEAKVSKAKLERELNPFIKMAYKTKRASKVLQLMDKDVNYANSVERLKRRGGI